MCQCDRLALVLLASGLLVILFVRRFRGDSSNDASSAASAPDVDA
jgi:hypothetical protein